MAYSNSNMSNEEMQNVGRVDREYKLYVNNIPPELNEDGIKEIFGQYGNITGLFYPRNAQWSFITYGTYQAAELAIRELNDKNPLYLKVAFAKERHDTKQEPTKSFELNTWEANKPKEKDIATSQVINHDMNRQSGMGRGEPLNCIRKNVEALQATSHKYAENRSPFLDEVSNMIEECGSSYDINELWTRGTVTLTADGKRHVSNGRGYTYEIPDDTPNMEEYIRKVCTQRNIGIYEYGNNKFDNEIRKCHVCPNKTTKHCEKCYVYYCSRDCQVNDWPRHQLECQRIPALIEDTADNISLLQIANTDENQALKSTIASNNKPMPLNNMQLRRPRVFQAQMEDSNSTNIYTKVNSNIDISNSNSDKCDNDISTSQTTRTNQSVVNKMNNRDVPQQNRSYNHVNQMKKHPSVQHPSASFPAAQYLVAPCPVAQYPAAQYPAAQYPAAQYPAAQYPAAQYPVAQHPSAPNPNHQSYNTQNYRHDTINKSITSPVRETINHDNRNEASNIPNKSPIIQEREFQNDSRSGSHNDKRNVNKQGSKAFDHVKNEEDSSFGNETYLEKSKFTDVEILAALDNGEYWISKVEDRDTHANLMRELQNIATKSHNAQPVIGNIYAVMYKTSWHRAIITSLNPTKVHLIDVGSTEIINKDAEIRDIQDLRKIPKLARKICLTPAVRVKYNNLKCGDKISVRMLSINKEKTIIVEVQEQTTDLLPNSSERGSQSNITNSIKNFPPILLPNVLDAITSLLIREACYELKITGVISIFEIERKNFYGASLVPESFMNNFHRLLDELELKCEQEDFADFKPQIGDLVCGKATRDNGWYRGYITMLSPDIRIAVIDEARVVSVSKLVPFPKDFQDICTFGVICETTAHELEVQSAYTFTAIINEDNLHKDCMKIEIKNGQNTLSAEIRPWKFSTKCSIPGFAELKTESKVCLTNYRSHYFMYVRSLDDQAVEYYNYIMQRVAEYAQIAPYVSEPLTIGKMVISKYQDGNNYRAMVTKIHGDIATIIYVDFGNLEDTNVKNLRVLSSDLGTQRSCTAKIVLKDVPSDIIMNKEANEYLMNLVGREVPLKCVFTGIPSRDGVYLTTPTGESVNDKINQLLKPGWKDDNYDDKTVYMMSHLKVASLGNVGETVQALILVVENYGKRYMMCPMDTNLLTYVFDVMPKSLKEYCESTEYYIPRARELCIALYQGLWYRAVCWNPKESDTTSEVFFVDYGNTESVEHKNIRLMPKDFITSDATASVCTVVNLAPTDDSGNFSTGVKERLSQLTHADSKVMVKIVECYENGDYKVELPIVRKILSEENLIPSS